MQIGSPIQVTTALAGTVVQGTHNNPNGCGAPLTINWTGGDANAWVTVRLISHLGPSDQYATEWFAKASDGHITLQGCNSMGLFVQGVVDVVMTVVPYPANEATLILRACPSEATSPRGNTRTFFKDVFIQ